jgi:hypothetical protein
MAEGLHAAVDSPPPFQFGIRSLLWATLVTARACAVLFPMPAEFAIPLMFAISMGLPVVLTTIIIYGSSYQRTFCIGAMFPAGLFLLLGHSPEWSSSSSP